MSNRPAHREACLALLAFAGCGARAVADHPTDAAVADTDSTSDDGGDSASTEGGSDSGQDTVDAGCEQADLVPIGGTLHVEACPTPIACVRVTNLGLFPAMGGMEIAFTDGDPRSEPLVLGSLLTPEAIANKRPLDLCAVLGEESDGRHVWAVVDKTNLVGECNEQDNFLEIGLLECPSDPPR